MEKLNKILKNVLVFLVIFLAINYLMQSCVGREEELAGGDGNLNFITTDFEYSRRQQITVQLTNNTTETVTLANECPGEPFTVYRHENNDWAVKSATPELDCSSTTDIVLEPGQELEIPYTNWNNALFSDMGRYRIELNTTLNEEAITISTNEFLVVKEGIIRQIAMGVFYRPIYNLLIFLAWAVPGHHLGLAIILLTMIIRTILLLPSQKAMRAQKRMQEIQPRLDKIKAKYKGDQQRIATETMAIWKESKISPVSSCAPMLMQFPFLIALFYVIRGGLNPDNAYLLYTQYANFGLHDLNVNFLGVLDLTRPNVYVLPLIVGGLQFIQMKLTMAKKPGKGGGEMAMATNMMTYMMPVMIAVFTATLPAGVGIYWGTSTLYGIVQQLFVNNTKGSGPKEPSVKVITS